MEEIEAIYVEDDDEEAFIMTVGMRRHQIKIVHISDITTARIIELLHAPYDQAAAVIFDAFLRGSNGLELAQILRAHGDTRPIFLLTAGENPAPETLELARISYISKPPHFEKLAAAIRGLK